LALIQHIGAASLGEGRLSRPKLDIYNACFDGTIVSDGSPEARLGRMLFGEAAVADASATKRAAAVLAGLDASDRALILKLLDRTVVHGWSALRDQMIEDEGGEDKILPRLINTLKIVGSLWTSNTPYPTHVVLARPHELVKTTGPKGDNGARANNEDKSTQLLNGAVALILR
jgi:hypothetical protein